MMRERVSDLKITDSYRFKGELILRKKAHGI